LKNVNQTQKKLLGVNITSSTRFFLEKKNWKKYIENKKKKGNRKTNFIFRNFKDQKMGK
jgi:hypothetical protein